MLQRTTQKIAFFLLEIDLIKEEDTEWCIYILKKWILTTSIFVVLFFEGRIWATPVQIIFYFVSLLLIRRRSGGLHARTPLRCMILSMIVEMICFTIIQKINHYFFFNILSLLLGGCVLWFVFPAIQKSDIKEMQANKRILRKGLIIEFSILLLAMSFLSKYFIIMKNLSYWNMGIIVAAICVIISRYIGNHVQ